MVSYSKPLLAMASLTKGVVFQEARLLGRYQVHWMKRGNSIFTYRFTNLERRALHYVYYGDGDRSPVVSIDPGGLDKNQIGGSNRGNLNTFLREK